MRRLIISIFIGLSAVLFVILNLSAVGASHDCQQEGRWQLCNSEGKKVKEIYYKDSDTDWPQYAALSLDDSFFRLNYGPNSAWGTSVILLPAFWSGGNHYHGNPSEPINLEWKVIGETLALTVTGTIGGLDVSTKVVLWPPKRNEYIYAAVTTEVSGSVPLDNRPGEAFKPVELSSMHISSTRWDTQAAYACLLTSTIPLSQWILNPPAYANIFGLKGGRSVWQEEEQQGKPAPTIEVWLDTPLEITGWVSPTNNPNDDNVGFWAASNQILSSWSYILKAAPEPDVEAKSRCLLASKTASPSPVQDGAQLTYTIRLTNTAGVRLTATITDILPSQVQPNGILKWGPITINPRDTWTKQFIVTTKNGYTGELPNRVQVTTKEGPIGWAGVTVCVNKCPYYLPIILKQ